jgi:hypothetical protein
MVPTFGGVAMFGVACRVQHSPVPNDVQQDGYPGINGVAQLMLGSRGRSFSVSGVFIDTDPLALEFDEGILLSYADGITRTFTDTAGNSWPNVCFNGEYARHPDGPKPTSGGWLLPFTCVLVGLS